MVFVGPLLAFASVGLLAFALLSLLFSEERQVTRALREVSEWEGQQAAQAEPLLQPFRTRVLAPAGRAVTRTLGSLLPANSRQRVQRQLELAGNPGGISPEGITGLRIVGLILTPPVAVVFWLLIGAPLPAWLWLLVIGSAAVGWVAPGFVLDGLVSRRQASIRRAIPDMLDMLSISVEAGLGFDMALAKLIRSTSGPLAEEFGRMLGEVQAGVSRREALRHLGDRTDVRELNNFIVAMVQADVFGVSIASILRTQAGEMRTQRRQYAEERAQKAPVKIVFPIVLCILPATLLVIVGPAAISISRALGFAR